MSQTNVSPNGPRIVGKITSADQTKGGAFFNVCWHDTNLKAGDLLQVAADGKESAPRITSHLSLISGRYYWVRNKQSGGTQIWPCETTINGLKLGEQWARPENHSFLFEHWEVFGPVPELMTDND